jgi:hypothetical protein
MHMTAPFISDSKVGEDAGAQLCGGDPGLSNLPYRSERAAFGDRSKSLACTSLRFHFRSWN